MTELGKAQRRRARVIEEERGKRATLHIYSLVKTITKIMGKNQTYAHTRIRRKQFPSFTMFKSVVVLNIVRIHISVRANFRNSKFFDDHIG